MKYRVISVCVDPDGHLMYPDHPSFDAEGRREAVIDTETNSIFADCTGPWDVEDRYRAFLNRLNRSWEHAFPAGKERVKVLRVEVVSASTAVDGPHAPTTRHAPIVQH